MSSTRPKEIELFNAIEKAKENGKGICGRIDKATVARRRIRRLLRAGVSANCVDAEGNTPAMAAVKHAHSNTLRILKLLVDHGADLTVRNPEGKSLMDLADIENDCYGQALFNFLTLRGVDSSYLFKGQHTLIRLAMKWRRLSLVQILTTNSTANNTDINTRNENGQTVLMQAASQGLNYVKAILAAKPNLNIEDYQGKTALFYAPDEAVMLALLKVGADYNVWAKDGESIFHIIVTRQYVNVLQYLKTQMPLVHKEILNAKKQGRTPLFYVAEQLALHAENSALAQSYKQIFILLYELGASRYIDFENKVVAAILPNFMQASLNKMISNEKAVNRSQSNLIEIMVRYGVGGVSTTKLRRGVCAGFTALQTATAEADQNNIWEYLYEHILIQSSNPNSIIYKTSQVEFTVKMVVAEIANLILARQFPTSKKVKALLSAQSNVKIFNLDTGYPNPKEIIEAICYYPNDLKKVLHFVSLFPENKKIEIILFNHALSLRYCLGNYYLRDPNWEVSEKGFSLSSLLSEIEKLKVFYKSNLVKINVMQSGICVNQLNEFKKLSQEVSHSTIQHVLSLGGSVELVRISSYTNHYSDYILEKMSHAQILNLFVSDTSGHMFNAMFNRQNFFEKFIQMLPRDNAEIQKKFAQVFFWNSGNKHPPLCVMLKYAPLLLSNIFNLLPVSPGLRTHLSATLLHEDKHGTYLNRVIRSVPAALEAVFVGMEEDSVLTHAFIRSLQAGRQKNEDNLFLLFSAADITKYIHHVCKMLNDESMQAEFIYAFQSASGLIFLNLILGNEAVKNTFNEAIKDKPNLRRVVDQLLMRQTLELRDKESVSTHKRKARRTGFFENKDRRTESPMQPLASSSVLVYFRGP